MALVGQIQNGDKAWEFSPAMERVREGDLIPQRDKDTGNCYRLMLGAEEYPELLNQLDSSHSRHSVNTRVNKSKVQAMLKAFPVTAVFLERFRCNTSEEYRQCIVVEFADEKMMVRCRDYVNREYKAGRLGGHASYYGKKGDGSCALKLDRLLFWSLLAKDGDSAIRAARQETARAVFGPDTDVTMSTLDKASEPHSANARERTIRTKNGTVVAWDVYLVAFGKNHHKESPRHHQDEDGVPWPAGLGRRRGSP